LGTKSKISASGRDLPEERVLIERCQDIQIRAETYLQMLEPQGTLAEFGLAGPLREVGLTHLTGARSALCQALMKANESSKADFLDAAHRDIDAAINNLRLSAEIEDVVGAMLTRAWLPSLESDADGAWADLDEAWDIAERGPMRLHMADIHLYRARLFFREETYPWKSPQDDLAAAEKLINECGYHRRDEELADAKRAILGV